MVLLKAERLPSAQVAERLGCCEVAVNGWLRRYLAEGVDGLRTRPGGGRKPILAGEGGLDAVRRAVRANRLGQAKAELERELGKGFSASTLKRFVKKTVDASNGCAGG